VPDFEQTVPLVEVLLYGILNPATIIVAFMLGQKANEKSKLLIAAFAGAIAGVAVLYVATLLRIWDAPTLGRSVAGVFIVSLVAGFVYAGVGYLMKRNRN
jgi:ABC-type Co2+ transport system permease subunit